MYASVDHGYSGSISNTIFLANDYNNNVSTYDKKQFFNQASIFQWRCSTIFFVGKEKCIVISLVLMITYGTSLEMVSVYL